MGIIKEKEALLNDLRIMGIRDERVIKAIDLVKRELFVREGMEEDAYGNFPLPIGYSQTISQPYTVAYMAQLLDIRPGMRILEIGSGSGYSAAVMGLLAGKKGEVYSIELIEDLCGFAKENLRKAGIKNVTILRGDGFFGYEKKSPFDRIAVAAACPLIPESLILQLSKKGILVLPLKKDYSEIMIRLSKEEGITVTEHERFAFVPLRGAVERQATS